MAHFVHNTLNAPSPPKNDAIQYCVGSTFPQITECICLGIYSISVNTVSTLIFNNNFINSSQHSLVDEGRVEILSGSLFCTSHMFSTGLRSGFCDGQFKCVNDDSFFWNYLSLSWFKGFSYCYLAPSGKKSIDGIK